MEHATLAKWIIESLDDLSGAEIVVPIRYLLVFAPLERAASLFSGQRAAVPVFVKKASNEWIYLGNYKCERYEPVTTGFMLNTMDYAQK